MELIERINAAAEYILGQCDSPAQIGVILGSGLGDYAYEAGDVFLPYDDIPYMMRSTVSGHRGQMVFGNIQGKRVCFMQGRLHGYEGYEMDDVVFPVRVMSRMGVKTLIVTNASGAVNTSLRPGQFVLVSDHINLGENPLRGENLDHLGPRFPDMSNAYDADLRGRVKALASGMGIDLAECVYAIMRGPSFETKAEIKMLRAMGADIVGMSTVPEVITANHAGMKVIAISLVTNMAAGILEQPLSHEEVMQASEAAREPFSQLLNRVIQIV